MELLVIAILLTVAGAQENQLEGPGNTVSVVGSNVTLKCLSLWRNCSRIDWQKYIPGVSPILVFRDREGISNAYRARYSIDNYSPGCHLVIRNVVLTDDGLFGCTSVSSKRTFGTTAYLTVLKTHPKCTINASEDKTAEGDGVHVTCEVIYNGTNKASMTWKGVDDAPAAVEKGITMSRSFSVAASAPEIPSFSCITSFKINNKYTNLATNIPVATCETPAVQVLYSVRNVSLSPSLSYYSPGSIITCTAKGRPLPTFKWQEMENDGTWIDIQNQKGSDFAVINVTSKWYRCVAVNVVRGKSYNLASHEFQVKNSGELTSINTCSSEDSREVGIGIGVGIGFLAAILLVSVASAILVKLRFLEFHPRPADKSLDGAVRHMEQEISPASHQLSAIHPSIPIGGALLVGEQDTTYESLGDIRDTNEYESLEQRH